MHGFGTRPNYIDVAQNLLVRLLKGLYLAKTHVSLVLRIVIMSFTFLSYNLRSRESIW